MTSSPSTAAYIRKLAAEHGIEGAEDEVDKFVGAITMLSTDTEISVELSLLAKLGEIGAVDTDQMMRLLLELDKEERPQSGQPSSSTI